MSDTENSPDDRFEEPPNVDPALVDLIGEAARLGDKSVIMAALEDLHPADASDALEQLEPELFGDVVALLGADLSSDILIELRNEYRNDAVDLLPDTSIAEALRALDSDDAAAILEGLSEGRRTDVLETLEAGDRTALERAMDFDEETAGRLMQREFVAAPEFWTVGHTVDHARASGDDLPDHFFEIYVVDPGFQVKGAVPLATLLRTPRDVRLAEIMNDIEAEITTDMDQEEVAYLFEKYNLISAPVVDESNRLVGMITVDDVVEIVLISLFADNL
ncbi:MAG: CBS domain-containing protein, partial [Pseudomonadota bacterium]